MAEEIVITDMELDTAAPDSAKVEKNAVDISRVNSAETKNGNATPVSPNSDQGIVGGSADIDDADNLTIERLTLLQHIDGEDGIEDDSPWPVESGSYPEEEEYGEASKENIPPFGWMPVDQRDEWLDGSPLSGQFGDLAGPLRGRNSQGCGRLSPTKKLGPGKVRSPIHRRRRVPLGDITNIVVAAEHSFNYTPSNRNVIEGTRRDRIRSLRFGMR